MTSSPCSDAVTLTIDALMAMTPVVNGQDIVQLASRHAFIGHVKRQPPVRDTFFPTSSRQPLADSWSPEVAAVLQDDVTWFDFSRYSVLYVAQAICKLRDKFLVHTMLEEDIVSEQLKAMHDSSGWKKIGFTLYTTLFTLLVKDETTKIPFRAYIDDNPRMWARRMCERVRDPRWVHAQFSRDVADSVISRDVNIFFIKLHLLDPTCVLLAFNSLNRAVLDLKLELATTNYLGDALQWTLISQDVYRAVTTASCPTNASRMTSTEPVQLYYGIDVCQFILDECHELGLWTGQYPDNCRLTHFRDRCTLM